MESYLKSITILNLDEELETLIREKAKKTGLSLNKTIQMLLREAFALDNKDSNKDEFLDLFGIWSKDDENEFLEKTKDFNKIDMEDWQ